MGETAHETQSLIVTAVSQTVTGATGSPATTPVKKGATGDD